MSFQSILNSSRNEVNNYFQSPRQYEDYLIPSKVENYLNVIMNINSQIYYSL